MAHAKPDSAHDHGHSVPLWWLFLALLALTAAEVALFEIWSITEQAGQPFMPKFAMVLLVLTFTIPKALIVLIYFMHLKFEKFFVVSLATGPFILVAICVLPILVDIRTLSPLTYNKVENLGAWTLPHDKHHGDHEDGYDDGHSADGAEVELRTEESPH